MPCRPSRDSRGFAGFLLSPVMWILRETGRGPPRRGARAAKAADVDDRQHPFRRYQPEGALSPYHTAACGVLTIRNMSGALSPFPAHSPSHRQGRPIDTSASTGTLGWRAPVPEGVRAGHAAIRRRQARPPPLRGTGTRTALASQMRHRAPMAHHSLPHSRSLHIVPCDFDSEGRGFESFRARQPEGKGPSASLPSPLL